MVEQILIAIDQLLNALLGGFADETLSARAYRTRNKPLGAFFLKTIDFIFATFFGQERHCYDSYIAEIKRRQLPKHYG